MMKVPGRIQTMFSSGAPLAGGVAAEEPVN
jgi:hypothetical protein